MPNQMNDKIVEILSAEECEKIARNTLKFKNDESIKIISYALEKGPNELVGFMGEYYKLHIRMQDEVRWLQAKQVC